ncbi:MAG TPA: TIGR01777 family oxidoreductase [Vicinamibacterales bacterium]|nr:TIGR01777 family oxidoreductase [Vicinamibacterales bacterium]
MGASRIAGTPRLSAKLRVLVTGATGFVGRALVPLLHGEGHSVVAWVRSEVTARGLLGADVEMVSISAGFDALATEIERSDAVVDLAGAPILGGRWTAARRAVLEDSRVGLTSDLVRAMAAAKTRPATLVSAGAVGYYGDRADEPLTETSRAAADFLGRLSQRWEQAAQQAEALGVRVVCLRTGVVLGRAGGALAQMLPAFQFGVGGPIGSGKQYCPWIHLHDLVRVIATALVDDRYRGPVNAVAPAQTTNRAFASTLGLALHRRAVLPLPALALKAIFGEAAVALLASQRVVPRALETWRFPFGFPTLAAALDDIVGGAPVTVASATSKPLGAEAARYELRTRTVVDAPLDETFASFSKAANLGLITPADMRFTIDGPMPPMAPGAIINYRVRIGPVPVKWRTRIAEWEPERRFVDTQEAGPYRLWWHEHTCRADGRRTIMDDRVFYTPPFGLLGRLTNRFFIAPTIKKIFQYRGDVIRLRFGAGR